MKLDLGTLANVIKHCDVLDRAIRGGNTPQTIGKLKALANDPAAVDKLIGALDGLALNMRALKAVEFILPVGE